jgi:hypothetical protein
MIIGVRSPRKELTRRNQKESTPHEEHASHQKYDCKKFFSKIYEISKLRFPCKSQKSLSQLAINMLSMLDSMVFQALGHLQLCA